MLKEEKKNIKILSKENNNFCLPKSKIPRIIIEEPTNSVANGQQNLEDKLISTNSVRAEIIWT